MASTSPNPVTCLSPRVPREPQAPEGAACWRGRSHSGLGLTPQAQAVGSPLGGSCAAVLGPESEPALCQLHQVPQLCSRPRRPSGDRGRGLAAVPSEPSRLSEARRVRAASLRAACGLSARVFLWAPQRAERAEGG